MKIRFLFAGNFDVDGQPRHYRAGDIEDVTEADAARLIDGKCAELADKPKEKVRDGKNYKQVA